MSRRKRTVERPRLTDEQIAVHAGNILWTDEEIDLLAEYLVELRLADPVSPLLPLLRQAQEAVLPEHRRRNINSTANVPAVVGRLSELLREERRLAREGLKAETRPEPVPPPFPSKQELKEEILGEMSTAEVLVFAMTRLASEAGKVEARLAKMEVALQKLLERQPHTNGAGQPNGASPKSPPTVPPPAKPRLFRIYVVGLLDKQQRFIAEACPKGADIRFCSKDQRVPVVPSGTDAVVLVKKFVGHDQEDAVRSQINGDKVHVVEGCIEGVREFIRELVLTEPGR